MSKATHVHLSALVTLAVLAVTASVMNAATTNVTIFYETHCPDSQKLLVEQVVPALNRFGSSVDFKLVPYGFASYRTQDGQLIFQCQHGPPECEGNTLHACAIKHYPNVKVDVIRFAACTMQHGRQVLDFIDECASKHYLSPVALHSCASSKSEGPELLRQMGVETTTAASQMFPKTGRFQFIPTVFIDGKPYVKEAFADLQGTICRVAVTKPPMCPQ